MYIIVKEIDCKINLCFYSARMQEIRQNLKTLIYLFVQINAVYVWMYLFICLFIYQRSLHMFYCFHKNIKHNCFQHW